MVSLYKDEALLALFAEKVNERLDLLSIQFICNVTDSFGFSPDSSAHSDEISRLNDSVIHPFRKIRSAVRALEALSLGRFSFLLKYFLGVNCLV